MGINTIYRVKPDPNSLENLAGNPEVAATFKELRNRLQQSMEATGDARLTDEYDKTSWVGPLKERKR